MPPILSKDSVNYAEYQIKSQKFYFIPIMPPILTSITIINLSIFKLSICNLPSPRCKDNANRVQKHQACSSVMAKYRANESRAKHTWAMPSAADIQRC